MDTTTTLLPKVSRYGTFGTFVVETANSVYAFDIQSSSTGVRAIVGGSILDRVSDIHRGVRLDAVIYDAAMRRPCSDCDVIHDITDLADMYVGKVFTFHVGHDIIDTSRVIKVWFA